MTTRLVLWLLLAGAGWAYAFWIYRRRELRVPVHLLLAGLRGGSIALLALLLMDVSVPWGDAGADEWWILDTSASMDVRQGGDDEPLGQARDALPAQGRALAFGAPVRLLELPLSPDLHPATDSRMGPALTRVLEAGASRITVLTDLRVQDPVEVAAIVRGARVPVSIVDLGGPLTNAGVGSVVIPATASSGEEVRGESEIFGEGVGPVRLSLEVGGEPVWDTVLGLQDDGRARIPIRVPVPDTSGPLPVRVRVSADGDVFPFDDVRSAILEVDPGAGELVLVSLAPDWEPRFLLPVLEEVTGLRGQGYLKVGEDRFMTMNGPVGFRAAAEVAAALEEARIGIAHGFTGSVPPDFAQAMDRVARLVRLPASTGIGPGGEWYVTPEVPASPLAGELAGIPLLGLPPLLGYVAPEEADGLPVLMVQRSARGDPAPALVLRGRSGRREVDARAYGFWRWAFREGPPRELYRRLWSAAAGWLLAGSGPAVREVGVGPGRSVVAPGEQVHWRAGPAVGGTLELRYVRDGDSTGDTPGPERLEVDSLGRAISTAPEGEGVYRWEARIAAGPGEGRDAAGLMVVESGELDLLPPRAVSLTELSGDGAENGGAGRHRPLRTHPLPYLLLLGLLSVEWVGRRRSGLR